MIARREFIVFALSVGLGLTGMANGAETAPAAGRALAAKDAIGPAAAPLPAEVVAAMQHGRYAEAEAALDRLAAKAKDPDETAYYALVRGIAQRLDHRADAARRTLGDALKAAPKGRWAAKIRYELATLELASGRVADAEALARELAEALLDGDRKDRLAEVDHAFARTLLKPDDPIIKPDPNAAYDLLAQARGLAKGETLRAALLYAMARASQMAGNHPRAIQDFQAYLKEYPKGADRTAARYHLGEAESNAGQHLAARRTWTDLARDLGQAKTPLDKEDDSFRARALDRIAQTYGIPNPPDDTSLNLGVAALRRFLQAYPEHPWAVRAAHQIGVSYLFRGQSQPALEAFLAFLKGDGFRAPTDEAKRDLAQLSMTATFQVGQILQAQEKFAEAIAAWKGYLAQYPNGPESADALRAILDTELQIANDHLRREHHAEARAAWQSFVAQNPLDGRVPQVLFQVGESFTREKKFDRAIAAWETLLSKFPDSEPAAHAQFAIAALFEEEKGDPATAIERFKKIAVEPWKSRGAQRVAVMESKALSVVTPRTFRSGESAHLKITTRNLEKLTFTAYRLNAEAYFRKKHALRDVESLDISLVRPDAEWSVEVPGYARYKPVETTYDLKKLEVPGVYVVKVTDEKTLQATTLVVGSDLDVIVKTSREQVLVFAQDMKTGQGRAGARVLVADDAGVILDARTGEDGVLVRRWDKPVAPRPGANAAPKGEVPPPPPGPPPAPCTEPAAGDAAPAAAVEDAPAADHPRLPNGSFSYLVLDGPNVAGSGLGVPEKVAQGLSPRAYLSTDRPAYRPGQRVALRGVVREVKDGQYANVPGAVYKLEVSDSRGRQIVARPVTLSAFGTFHETIPLDSAAPVGIYHVRVYQPGKSEFAGQFEVQAYQLEKIDLSFDLKKTVYFRGETVEADLIARYPYGAPVANRPIAVLLPDNRVERGMTDGSGKYHVSFSTEGFADEQALRLAAQLPQDNVGTVARVMLAVRAFAISLQTTRDVYLDGESFLLRASTFDAQGEPTGQTLSVSVLKRVTQAGRTAEREVARKEVTTDPKTGQGSVALKVEDEQGGSFILRVAGTDRFSNPVVADRELTISGKKDETRLRILADRQTYQVGEEASVNLHSRGRAGTALLAWEADRILQYRLVKLNEGDNRVGWAIDHAQFPNFTLTACRMSGTHFDEASLDVRVERDLRVSLKPKKPSIGPGESVEVEVTTVDQLGRPVAAEVAVALIDRALLRRFEDRQPAIGPFFYDQTRTGAFATAATNTFKYEPATSNVSEAVVEENERTAARTANAADRGGIMEEAKRQAVATLGAQGIPIRAAPAPVEAAATPPPAAPEGAPAPAGAIMTDGASMHNAVNGPPAGNAAAGKPFFEEDMRRGGATALGEKDDDFSLFYGHNLSRDASEKQWAEKAGEVRLRKSLAFNAGLEAGKPVALALPPRERFVETAYWNPSVVTDKEGKATITFNAPMALAEYRFSARGVTGADTLVGQTTEELVVRKDFFVDLKVPAALTQGDRPRFLAQVHHVGVTGQVAVKLVLYAGGRETVEPRTIDVKADGIDEVAFEPFEVPDGDVVRLTLTAAAGAAKDELVTEVPIRPWGVPAFASASGTSSDDATVFVGLPTGRVYENPEMLIVLSPTLRRMLIELALGQDAYPMVRNLLSCSIVPPNTMADRASDLLAATQAYEYLRATRATAAPEAARLTDRIQGLVSELTAAQNEDGGWLWISGPKDAANPARPSDRSTTARVVWALASAEPIGLLTDPKALDKSAAYLTQELAKVGGPDHDTRALLLHALSTRHKATFEQVNSLNRVRQGLSDAALAYLALTLANLDRASLADEVLGLLVPRAKSESAGAGQRARRYWPGQSPLPFNRGAVEATALAALAFAKVRPQAPELEGAVDWLLAHRQGTGWLPHKANGPALAALAGFYGRAQGAEDRYRLVVSVNEAEVARLDVTGAAEGRALVVPRKVLKVGDRNRVRFAIEGRGTFGYAVTMTGFTRDFTPDQDSRNRVATVQRRVYHPAAPELEGKVLPTGFGVAVNATPFTNKASQVALGGTVGVEIQASRADFTPTRPDWERNFLVVEEHLPAGTTLIEGSVQSQASSYTQADNVLTFYFAPDQWPGQIRYAVHGYLPGRYRTLPTSIRDAYEPGRMHLGPAGDLRVNAPGEPNTDPYQPTPEELYARGKAQFDAGRLTEAATPLEALFTAYTLRDDIAKEAARMLLLINIHERNARKIVQYFEVVKEKAPELVLSFDQLRAIGKAYTEINEYERAYLVWRGVIEASYLEDAHVGEVLRQRGKTLEAIAYLIGLWREYPDTASIESDFFGLSQVLARQAGQAITDPTSRRALADAGVTRSALLLQAIRLIQTFLTLSPKNPMADEASLALVGSFLELEDFEAVVKLAGRFAALYPRSTFLDSFQYSEALGEFHLGHYDRAIAVAETIAKATYQDPNGVEQPSPNKWQAIYILGQIHDARRQPSKALTYYEQVAERFTDAAGAVKALTRKELKLPEVTVVRSASKPVAAAGAGDGFRAVAPTEPAPKAKPGIDLDYRNIAEIDVKVYPVDLMRLYLTRRNLDAIAGIDLAGITPLLERTIPLGKGEDFEDKVRTLDLPLEREGAYLVMVRGGDRYASGIVLVTPLALEVLEESESGRVRVTVHDAATRALVPKVQVKVIGSNNTQFVSGETDLRGVFVAEAISGQVTAVARQGGAQYAFYRGTTAIGPPPAQQPQAGDASKGAPQAAENAAPGLDVNLKIQNSTIQMRNYERLQNRLNPTNPGGAEVRGFK